MQVVVIECVVNELLCWCYVVGWRGQFRQFAELCNQLDGRCQCIGELVGILGLVEVGIKGIRLGDLVGT